VGVGLNHRNQPKVFYFYDKTKTKIMKAILNFIDAWGVRIMVFLVVIIFFKTCTTNTKVQNVNDSVDSLSVKLRKEIKIEGLKSEKRAIQASDRKILDVNRQTEIDQETTCDIDIPATNKIGTKNIALFGCSITQFHIFFIIFLI